VAGYTFALSTAKVEKSSAFPKISTIIFDEFILDKGYHHYIPDEVVNFLELYETISRMRSVTVFFVSNAITWTNPYFTYFNITLPKNQKKISVKNDVLIQIVDNKEFETIKKETRFGVMMSGTKYGKYAFENEFLRDTTNFVLIKAPAHKQCQFIIKAVKQLYGVWLCFDEGIFYVSTKLDPSTKLIYTAINEIHQVNTILLKGRNKSEIFKDFVDQYKSGNVFFDSIGTKNIILEIMKVAM
jgi:hypothetical protein